MFVLSLLLLYLSSSAQGQLTVTSLPAVLFSGGSQRIVEGSVVLLYCEVNYNASTVTWNKDNVPLVQDVPHIRIRNSTSDTSTTFLLVVDNFQASDNGTYQCTAQNGTTTANGTALTLTAYNSSTDGSLRIVARTGDNTDMVPDNRTEYQMGNTATLSFEIGHVGDNSTSYPTPSVMWLKDGTPVIATPTNTPGANGRINTILSFTFQESDAGVYQCVITGNNSELFATIPIRLDTGETHTIERMSPSSIIILRPPDKLVLEVRATGRYNLIEWRRNGVAFSFSPGSEFTVTLQELPNFFEIFVREPTTRDDLGVFTAELSPALTTREFINFAVIEAVDANTTVNDGASVVTVSEGGSVNISCTSTGVPAPTITWRLNNQPAPFNQTDLTTPVAVDIKNNFELGSITTGKVVSTLHIVNAQYPGVYECMGKTTYNGVTTMSSAIITVHIKARTAQGHLVVTSLPVPLFSGGSQRIVEGSVVWLYCEVNSTESTLTVAWNKDGVPLIQDVPHIRMRNSTSDTSITFLLVVDNFQASDNGTYQCTAQDGGATANGIALTLTAYNSSINGSLQVVTNDPAITHSSNGVPADNRTGYQTDDSVLLSFEIGHVGDDSTPYSTPSVMWLKDGTPIRTTPTNTPGANGRITTTLSFHFDNFRAGVYQCVIIGNNSELLATIPIRLDTRMDTRRGTSYIETLTLERVSSSSTIVLLPPEELVLEVRAAGRYHSLSWMKNGDPLNSPGFPARVPQEAPHFYEIFVRSPTSRSDLGVYEAVLQPVPGSGQETPDRIKFAVITPVDSNTTVNGGASVVTVSEGGSVNISCTSTGVPAPTITWRLNNQAAPFRQTDLTTPVTIDSQKIGSLDAISIGNVVSTLHIVNAQYPAHDGVYECIGDNSDNGTATISATNITVHVQEIEANITRVGTFEAGGEVVLNCTVVTVRRGTLIVDSLDIDWMWPNGTTVTSEDNSSFIWTRDTAPHTQLLTFNPLRTSQAGEYTCRVTFSRPGRASENISSKETIIIQIPPSSIGIIASPIPDNFFSGLQLNLTCRTELDAAVNTEQNVTMTWTKSRSSINPFRISISSPQRVHSSPQIYESSLIFSSLSVYSDDEGEYVCSVSVKPLENPQLFLASPTIRSSQRVRIDSVQFQLRLLSVLDCTKWINEDATSKVMEVTRAIVNGLQQRCQCSITVERITNAGFRCFPQSPQAVTYRARLHGTPQASVSGLLSLVKAWIVSDASIVVQAQLLSPDKNCMVAITSPNEDECQLDELSEPTGMHVGAIIGGTIGLFAVITVIMVVSVVIIVALVRNHQRNHKIRNGTSKPQEISDRRESSGIHFSEQIQQVPLPYEEVQVSHDYDYIDWSELNSDTTATTACDQPTDSFYEYYDFSVTECPAYSADTMPKTTTKV